MGSDVGDESLPREELDEGESTTLACVGKLIVIAMADATVNL